MVLPPASAPARRREDRPVVVGLQGVCHQTDVVAVGIGLELVRLKIFVVVLVIHGEGFQPLPSLRHFPGTDGGDDAGIQSTGEKTFRWDVRTPLPPDGIRHQKAHLLHRFVERIPVFPVHQFPVPAQAQLAVGKISAAPRFQLGDSPEHAASRSRPGPRRISWAAPFSSSSARTVGYVRIVLISEANSRPPSCFL